MNDTSPSRRSLIGAIGAGMTLAFAGRSLASDGGLSRPKLVIVVCRGGMDGLAVTPPIGAPDYPGLRGAIAFSPAETLPIDADFALHPSLGGFHRLIISGEARIVPALASPDRARSHFEAQDVLESGASSAYGAETGWLNRTLQVLNPGRAVEALSVGATAPLILRGPAVSGAWSPGGKTAASSRLSSLLTDLYAGDSLLGPALAQGLETELMAATALAAADGAGTLTAPAQGESITLGRTVAGFMVQPGGPDLVAISADGYDTHANQGRVTGALSVRLAHLDGLVEGLRTGLGAAWRRTVVVCVTEFGRTARVNGTRGTDHGTGSTALLAGGALKPGGIVGDWPGLAPAALFEGRDLRPTVDSRSLFKGLLLDHLGIDRRALDRTVFPDSLVAPPLTGLV